METSDLEKIGIFLYGKHWKTAMARDLDYTPRQVGNWHRGGCDVPSLIMDILLQKIVIKTTAPLTGLFENHLQLSEGCYSGVFERAITLLGEVMLMYTPKSLRPRDD